MVSFRKLLLGSAVCILMLVLFSGVVYADQTTNQNAVITGSVVNLREAADTSSKILAKLPKGTVVSVIKESTNWYYVNYDNLKGWVSGEYLSIKETTLGSGVVTTEILNVRSKPDISSDVITKLKEYDKVTLLERSEDWYRIKTPNGETGWASSEFISIRKASMSRGDYDNSQDSSEGSSLSQQIVDYAKRFLGYNYVYGGNGPSEGFDCSGFTKYVFAKFGVTLERTAADQATQGTKVLREDLRPADIVLFDTNGGSNYINHVGIYIGNGKFIHASSPRRGVIITDLSDAYYQRSYMRSRSII